MMKKVLMLVLIVLMGGIAFIASAETAIDFDVRPVQDILEEMIVYYGSYGDEADEAVSGLLGELKAVDQVAGAKWESIMKLWKSVETDPKVNVGILPDGLPYTDELCMIVLGFKLNPDGSMQDELVERLKVALASAEKYPNAFVAVTGGGTAENDASATEAGRMAEWLIQNGLDSKRLIVEDHSLTTAQNAIFTYQILTEKYPQVKQLAIISSDYHIATGTLLYSAKATLEAEESGKEVLKVVSNAAYDAPPRTLSTMFQAGALIEITGDTETAFDIYYETYDIHPLPKSTEGVIPIKVLLIPKFEIDAMTGDFPGEAQFYYEAFLKGGKEYKIISGLGAITLYVKDGVALFLSGMSKLNAALNTVAVLSDSRFDFSNAYVISTGCAGSSYENTVLGDVFIITAAINYDLGHHADSREMKDGSVTTWFHDSLFDDSAVLCLNPELMDCVYDLVKDVPVQTTEQSRNYMIHGLNGAAWAGRDPQVMRGTTVTSDNYWKGEYDHKNAILMVETYGCPDPYVTSEMEELAIAKALQMKGMLDRLIIIRDSVNMDIFVNGQTPETLWVPKDYYKEVESGKGGETSDIFAVAMENNFKVGNIIIQAILNGSL